MTLLYGDPTCSNAKKPRVQVMPVLQIVPMAQVSYIDLESSAMVGLVQELNVVPSNTLLLLLEQVTRRP